MIFSSLTFLYIFLPAVLLLVLIARRKWHNSILLFASLIFYAWGGVSYTLILLISILINYLAGRAIARHSGSKRAKQFLVVGVVLNLLMLGIFKYANFIFDNVDELLAALGWQPVDLKTIALPIGISFFTFQAISYLADVYEKKTTADSKLINVGLYIALFPQLIAGPIVRYRDIAAQIVRRRMSWAKFSYGVERFIWGLAKKVLLANTFAVLADDILNIHAVNLDPLTAWTGLLFYTMQLYFDFSGYSDMAIGLGSMLGFRIPENFNFPYISRSIREFWRRWHMTLSQWFRDYVYIPMGGSRKSTGRTYFNLFTIFVLVGLWHGAAWTYVLFGLIHGIFMAIERVGFERWLQRRVRILSHIYAMGVFMLSLVFFRLSNVSDAWVYIKALFGSYAANEFQFELAPYFGTEMIVLTAVGLLACTPVFRWLQQRINETLQQQEGFIFQAYDLAGACLTITVFLYCTISLAMGTYNPFIYYQF